MRNKISMKKLVSLSLALLLMLSTLAVLPVSAETPKTWADSTSDTYYISSVDDMLAFRETYMKNNMYIGKTVYLTADIDMEKATGWMPVPYFYGTFDGQGHTISNLSYTPTGGESNLSAFIKLFAGELKNVRFEDCVLTNDFTDNKWVAALVGKTYRDAENHQDAPDSSKFENVYVDATVNAGSTTYAVGGFVGRADLPTEIVNCEMKGSINGFYFIGGFIGQLNNGEHKIQNSVAHALSIDGVTGSSGKAVGGFVGFVDFQSQILIENCASMVNLKGYDGVGGFIGGTKYDTTSTLIDCVFAGDIVQSNHSGGIIGKSAGTVSMTRCVNLGSSANTYAWNAGLIALESRCLSDGNNHQLYNPVSLTDCYSVASVDTNYIVYRHTNRLFGKFKVTVSYSNEETPRITTTNDALDITYSDAQVKAISDAIVSFGSASAAVLTKENFKNYTALSNWIVTDDVNVNYNNSQSVPLILPEGAASTLGYATADVIYQVSTADNADGTKNIRLLTAVRDLDAKEAGFGVQITRTPLNSSDPAETSAVIPVTSTTVYTSIYGKLVAGEDERSLTAADIWGAEYEGYYIVAIAISGVDYANYAHTFSVTSQVTMADSTVLSTAATLITPDFN